MDDAKTDPPLRLAAPLFRPGGPGRVTWRCRQCRQPMASDGAEQQALRALPAGQRLTCPHCGRAQEPEKTPGSG